MSFSMIVSLYTSRVVLEVLGVEDYGIYGVVGGVVGLLSFLNGTLSIGTSRFLTFALGERNIEKLKRIFSTALSIHLLLAIIITLLAETVGLWFVYNKLVIALDRLDAALIVYHLSIISTLIVITQVPYNASIISHERMKVYAYLGIVEVLLKLGIVFLLKIGTDDKLVLYAILLLVVQILIALFYRIYCIRNFEECKYKFILDKKIAKSMISFSGWNLIANLSLTLNSQGVIIITNLFFGPLVVAAQTIVNQVNMAIMQFVNNFRTAINPQIIKTYAIKEYEKSKNLTLSSTCYIYYLLLLISLPILLLANNILNLWLTSVPEYTVIFLQLIIIQNLIDSFGSSFYVPLMASGHIKGNSLSAVYVGCTRFVLVYVLFSKGFPPTTVLWVGILAYSFYSFLIKPYLLIKNVGYKWTDFTKVFLSCFKVTALAILIPILASYFLGETLLDSFIILVISVLSVAIVTFYIGLDSDIRHKIQMLLKTKMIQFNVIKNKNDE